jgi:hypothetical protein
LGGIEGHRSTSQGWMARHDIPPGRILWEVHEAYQPAIVKEKLTRGPLEYAALRQIAQRLSDRPVKFGFHADRRRDGLATSGGHRCGGEDSDFHPSLSRGGRSRPMFGSVLPV